MRSIAEELAEIEELLVATQTKLNSIDIASIAGPLHAVGKRVFDLRRILNRLVRDKKTELARALIIAAGSLGTREETKLEVEIGDATEVYSFVSTGWMCKGDLPATAEMTVDPSLLEPDAFIAIVSALFERLVSIVTRLKSEAEQHDKFSTVLLERWQTEFLPGLTKLTEQLE